MYMHYFRYVEEVARNKSFTKAANNLYISQQSLSEHIKRIEEYYGVRLFQRKPSLQLTHAGELFMEYISQSIHREERLLAEFSYIRSQQKGKIRVGITPTRAPIFLPHIFSRFNKLYPLVELSLREDHTSLLIKDLMDSKIDFIIGLEDIDIAQKRIITSTTLLRDRKMYFLVSRKLLLQFGFPEGDIEGSLKEGVGLSQIQTIPIILNPNKSKIHAQIAQEYFKLNTKPKIVIESSNLYPLLPLCGSGNVGVFMSRTILRHVAEHYSGVRNGVLTFLVRDIPINCDITLMHLFNKPISAQFSDFIDVTKNIFAEYTATKRHERGF